MGHPSTGKRIRTAVMDLYRIAEGRIAEVWGLTNSLDFRRQLGILPDDRPRERGAPVPPSTPPPPR
jgi:hypothetical protein